jgi:hypothetical protein
MIEPSYPCKVASEEKMQVILFHATPGTNPKYV